MATRAEFRPVPAPGAAEAIHAARGGAALRCLPWRELEHRGEAWDQLAATSSEPNPFYERWYLQPSLQALDPEGDVLVLCFEAQGRLAGLMPLLRQRRYYRYPLPNLSGWVHANCFLGAPLVARGQERAFWQALLAWADARAGLGLFLHLRQLPLSGPLCEALVAVLREHGRKAGIVHSEERAMLASDLTPDAYLEAAMSGKKRKELRRQFARLSELGEVAVERRDDDAGLAGWVEDFLRLEAAGWKGRAGSALACYPETAALFREAMAGGAARGSLERLTLSLDGRPIAMLATFLSPPGAFSYKTAFDESFARFSPGVLLQRENLAILGREGIAWSDSCAAADHPMIDHVWRERRPVGSLSIAIGGPLRRAAFHRLMRAEVRRNPAGREL